MIVRRGLAARGLMSARERSWRKFSLVEPEPLPWRVRGCMRAWIWFGLMGRHYETTVR